MMENLDKLDYEIYNYSSYSTSYLPENILEDSPSNQASRWSSNTNNPPQFLTLKLKRPAIVRQIKFGKFEKSHVCNLKKFRIFGGLDEDKMLLLLESGLKNDSTPESFSLRYTTEGENFPVLFLKIMPLLSWGPSFNFSIWYVEVHGQDDPIFMSSSLRDYNMVREVEIVKLCLKHFRQQGYDNAFKALQEQTNVRLEHPIITELHECLVINGDFQKAEQFIEHCVNDGLMDSYMAKQDYKHSWKIQETLSTIRPGTRGGHQLVIDPKKRLIYLYGGWDGFHDLSDLWCFDIEKSTWTLIFENSELFDGPKARSCHKMVFDPISENIFMIGRYLDNSIRTIDYVKSDFYLYDTKSRTWLQICDDTSQVGGPQLIYDHQMCIDIEKRTIYVFGGKILTPNVNQASSEPEYSGLFSYHIATNTWTQILVDCHHQSASLTDVLSIKSRVTHCMVFHNKNRKLYIYGGQRGKEEIDDFISYDVDTQMINVLNPNNCGNLYKSEPPAGFTQRATIDCERDEIYVFSSLSKQKEKRDPQQIDASNSFWVYSLRTNKWSRIYTCKHASDQCYNKIDKGDKHAEPCPRYAHQLVFDEIQKVHYLFGGNPGKTQLPQLRLDDFWVLLLEKPTRQETLRYCQYLVRKLKYEEITKINPIYALQYLQNHISEVIDHNDPVQLNNFHKLASLLFKGEDDVLDEKSQLMTIPVENKPTRISSFYVENEILSKSSSFYNTKEEQLPLLPNNTNATDCKSEDVAMSTDDSSIQSTEDISTPSTSSVSSPLIHQTISTQSIENNMHQQQNQHLQQRQQYHEFIPHTSHTSLSGVGAGDDTYELYRKCGGKRSRDDYNFEIKTRRTYLFNKIVELMPNHMVQPKGHLSDFVLI
ncbi:muskelin isoform X2 [Condylostylus longicornis]|uniref:muskelin isoform X2 n=1 Tax=Condylostylus longicornis TaxID=2530218 RepID=UPI00244E4047|nr:muskelin isoform X2 [Condylostylus longicornis]